MKTLADIDTSKLLVLLQSCHSILGTAWPRPGYPQLTGAKTFIGTNLFTALENGAAELDQLFSDLESTGTNGDLVLLWRRCHDVIKRLKVLGRASDNPHIDSAFNLLYLASGVLYQEMAHALPEVPKQDARFSTVGDIADLKHQCQWQATSNAVAKQITDTLVIVLKTL